MNIDQAFATAVKFQKTGRVTEACQLYERIIAKDYAALGATNNLGILLFGQNRHEDAIRLFRRAVSVSPGTLNAYNNLASLLRLRNRPAEAEHAYRASLRLTPDQPTVLNDFGILLEANKRPGEAGELFARACALTPDDAEFANNHGAMLRVTHRLDEAIARFRRAIALNPQHSGAYSNLGSALKEQAVFWESLLCFRRARTLEPGFAGAHWNESLVRLVIGDFPEGWSKYEWRWRHGRLPSPQRSFTEPRWDGSPLNGRRLLVYWEQGFGDVLQFVRYLPLLRGQAGSVILECQHALVPLMRGLPGVSQIVATGGPLPPFDVQIPVMSLGLVFGTRLETIPNRVPYLHAEPDLAAHWRARLAERLGARAGDLKVGIVWAGSPTHGNDRNRSQTLAAFARFAAIPGVSLVSIQKGPSEGQAAAPPPGMPLLNLSPEIRDFADTAAIMVNLDLVLCVDTSVAHLAGALGVPVWVLLPFAPDWRWLLDREDSPWYPTMRLFRQTRTGQWDDVLSRVEDALRATAGAMAEAVNSHAVSA